MTSHSPPPNPFQFRLAHLFYVISLLGSSLALFGTWGILATALVLGLWRIVFAQRPLRKRLVTLSKYLGAVLLGMVILLPAFQPGRTPGSLSVCNGNFSQLSFALTYYHLKYGSLPPASETDGQGNQFRHSWRVYILPMLGRDDLYAAYNLQEPWDGPNNIKLIGQMPSVFRCPSSKLKVPPGHTTYLAVVGEDTIWSETGPRSLTGIPDGAENTLLLFEAYPLHVPWTSPHDASLSEARDILTATSIEKLGPHRSAYHGMLTSARRKLHMANNTCHFVGPLKPEFANEVLLVNDGSKPSFEAAEAEFESVGFPYNMRRGAYIREFAFFVLALLPLPWAFRRRPPTKPALSPRDAVNP